MAYSFIKANGDKISFSRLTALDGASKATWSVWVKTSTTNGNSRIVEQMGAYGGGSGTGSGIGLYMDGSAAARVQAATENNDSSYCGALSDVMTYSAWNHIYAIYDGTKSTASQRWLIYVNGSSVSLSFSGTTATTIGTNDQPLVIANGTSTVECAELAIWANLALTDATLISNLAAGKNPMDASNGHPTGLTFYAPLRSDAVDLIASSTGTITGASLSTHPTVDAPPASEPALSAYAYEIEG